MSQELILNWVKAYTLHTAAAEAAERSAKTRDAVYEDLKKLTAALLPLTRPRDETFYSAYDGNTDSVHLVAVRSAQTYVIARLVEVTAL